MSEHDSKQPNPPREPSDEAARSEANLSAWLAGIDFPSEFANNQIAVDPHPSGGKNSALPNKEKTRQDWVDLSPPGEFPTWAELPRLEMIDQPSMAMAFRLPATPILPTEPTPVPPPTPVKPTESESPKADELDGDPNSPELTATVPIAPDAAPTSPPLVEPPPGIVVVNDTFPELERLGKNKSAAMREILKPRPGPVVERAAEPSQDLPVEKLPPTRVPGLVVEKSPAAPAASNVVSHEPTATVQRGRPVVYGMVVRNTSAEAMYHVRVEHELPVGPRFLSADPQPQISGRRLTWDLGTLEPGAKHRFQVTIQPNRADELPEDATALFQVYQCLHNRSRILRPVVTIALAAPAVVNVGEMVPLAIEVQNTGNGAATDLRVVIPLPPGLANSGDPAIEFRHPRLAPGGRARFEFDIVAERPGDYALQAQVIGPLKVLAVAEGSLRAVAPELHLRVEGPPKCKLDEPFEYHIDVSNLGQAATGPIRVAMMLPDGIGAASPGSGEISADNRSVSWGLDSLLPHDVRRLAVSLSARRSGEFSLRVEAWDEDGQGAATTKSITCDSVSPSAPIVE
jgi:uncharacterized repeat protein (TIGR01451 family)